MLIVVAAGLLILAQTLGAAATLLLAQAVGGYTIVQICVAVVIIAAAIALLYVALRQFGVAIPP